MKKNAKNEAKPKSNLFFSHLLPSDGDVEPNTGKYIKNEQTESLSNQLSMTDRLIFNIKELMNKYIYSLSRVSVSVKTRYLLWQKRLDSQRQLSLKSLERVVGPRGLPLVEGMLFGELSGISQDTYHSFKVIGILHILSASSANFTIFLQFFLFFLKPLLIHMNKTRLFFLNFSIIFLYFSLVGSSASTLRAFLTLSLAFYASFILKRGYLSIFNLYIVAILMLTINPFYLDSLSFQFSFLASFGIIFLYNYLEKEPFINKNILFKNILLTVCAQFFLLPIMVSRFGELNYLAILANILVLPLVELLTILFLVSFICLFMSSIIPITFFESFISFLITKVINILFLVIDFLERSPWKSIVFENNKDLYTNIFFFVDLLAIIAIFIFKRQRYLKDQYRTFK